jgi:hypothetical protein
VATGAQLLVFPEYGAIEVAAAHGRAVTADLQATLRAVADAEAETTAMTLDPRTAKGSAKDLRLPVRVPLHATATGSANLLVQLTLYYCREDNTGTCRIKTLLFRAPVEITDAQDAPKEVEVRASIDAK